MRSSPSSSILTSRCSCSYNMLFRFLLLVKRVETELQQCWAWQMQRRHSSNARVGTRTWCLRNNMAFLVSNLQYYLQASDHYKLQTLTTLHMYFQFKSCFVCQVDVIESQCSLLLDKISKTQDFETIRFAHDSFLNSLLAQSFLLTKPVRQPELSRALS